MNLEERSEISVSNSRRLPRCSESDRACLTMDTPANYNRPVRTAAETSTAHECERTIYRPHDVSIGFPSRILASPEPNVKVQAEAETPKQP